MNREYLHFIEDIKENILRSRYRAVSHANREQLLLYFKIGQLIVERQASGKWGTNILEKVAVDLQKKIPGLRGFSTRNLRNMRLFYQEYYENVIWQSLTAKLLNPENQLDIIFPSLPNQVKAAFSISFTHHILILNKCGSGILY